MHFVFAESILLAHRYLHVDRRGPKTDRAGFDNLGTLLLALTLADYALAIKLGAAVLVGSMWLCYWRLPSEWASSYPPR